MQRARAHPLVLTLISFLVSLGAALAIAAAYGFASFAGAWSTRQWSWLLLAAGGSVLAIGSYVVCYRAATASRGGPKLPWTLVYQAVIRGFAPFAVGGGFAVDKRVLHAIQADERTATVRVLGLGALEWALLAPAAWLGAVVLLVVGDSAPMPSLLWPWAVAVPIGFALGFSLATPGRRQAIARRGGRWRIRLAHGMEAVEILRFLGRGFTSCWAAWLGMACYWALDIASFYGALRFIGLHLNLGELILAYATGYALTRRSMPLGGAGVTEVLMTFSLHWVGAAVLPALAAVVVYRFFNLVLLAVPALLARPRIRPLLDAADSGETLAVRQRPRRGPPLGVAHH